MSEYRFEIDANDYRVQCSGFQSHGHFRVVADNRFAVTDSFGYCNPESRSWE